MMPLLASFGFLMRLGVFWRADWAVKHASRRSRELAICAEASIG